MASSGREDVAFPFVEAGSFGEGSCCAGGIAVGAEYLGEVGQDLCPGGQVVTAGDRRGRIAGECGGFGASPARASTRA